ncbi:NAD(P)-dependent oxidoreductase [Trueperella pyogenes]|uniref:NAD(P)-dependent oxidoreductase n=1 Tax=Trueperella pyogenes TaxID=1661 RepID=UPI003249AEDE
MKNVTVSIHPFWNFEIDIPGVSVVRWDFESEPPVDRADVVVTSHWATPNGVEMAQKVGASLLQIGSIGYDMIAPDLPAGLQIANAATVHEAATAETVVLDLLIALRDVPRMAANTAARTWEPFYAPGLTDKRIVLVGVGGVGSQIVQRLRAFNADITYVASRERDEDFGHVYSLDTAPAEVWAQADAVVVVIPATPDTRGLIDADFLAKLKDGAVLVNAGRGVLAVNEALVAEAGRLRIVLDVADPEPLPADSPLWDAAFFISHHNGGNTDAMHPRMKALVERQVRAALAGEDYVNVVLPR